MRLFTLLQKIITKINENSSDISSYREIIFDNYYSNSTTVANVKNSYINGVKLTLPKKGIYLVLMHITASVASAGTTLAITISDATSRGAQNTTVLMGGSGISVMNSGGGVVTWGLVEATEDNAIISSYTYGYYTGTCNYTIKATGIRIPTLSSSGGGLSSLKGLFSFNKRGVIFA